MISAAILAGGQARRLGGRDKGALAVGAASILDRQLTVLREITPHIIIVGGSAPAGQIGGVRTVPDRIPGAGALGGLYTALEEAQTEQVVVVACDMPFLTAPFLRRLVELGADPAVDAVVPRDARGRHPLAAAYARGIAGHLASQLAAGRLRVLDALAGLRVRDMGPEDLAPFDADGRLLMNVNTPDDYARARSLA